MNTKTETILTDCSEVRILPSPEPTPFHSPIQIRQVYPKTFSHRIIDDWLIFLGFYNMTPKSDYCCC
jgi:hypothetical protein